VNSIALTTWKDAGVASGAFHMYADAETLDVLQARPFDRLVIRVFQWDQPTISYGYLLDAHRVTAWAQQMNLPGLIQIKRPTGGGAVLHTTKDLSFSLAWRRDTDFFSDSPRLCYEQIHQRLLAQLGNHNPAGFSLFTKASGGCESPLGAKELPVCFNEPVCNDVMSGAQKVVGGALRITKTAILYQGTIQLPNIEMDVLKGAVRRAFGDGF
jgi:lipoate-protein ligase A